MLFNLHAAIHQTANRSKQTPLYKNRCYWVCVYLTSLKPPYCLHTSSSSYANAEMKTKFAAMDSEPIGLWDVSQVFTRFLVQIMGPGDDRFSHSGSGRQMERDIPASSARYSSIHSVGTIWVSCASLVIH